MPVQLSKPEHKAVTGFGVLVQYKQHTECPNK